MLFQNRMSKKIVTGHENESMSIATELMNENTIPMLPVLKKRQTDWCQYGINRKEPRRVK